MGVGTKGTFVSCRYHPHGATRTGGGHARRTISTAEARGHPDESGVVAVWVMDPDSDVRSVAVSPGAPDDAVVDLALETETGYRMYSYTGGQWMDYGTQRKDDDEAPRRPAPSRATMCWPAIRMR